MFKSNTAEENPQQVAKIRIHLSFLVVWVGGKGKLGCEAPKTWWLCYQHHDHWHHYNHVVIIIVRLGIGGLSGSVNFGAQLGGEVTLCRQTCRHSGFRSSLSQRVNSPPSLSEWPASWQLAIRSSRGTVAPVCRNFSIWVCPFLVSEWVGHW